MSAIREPGPYYIDGVEVGAEREDWSMVEVSCKSPVLMQDNHLPYPAPTPVMLKWMRETGIHPEEVAISEYDITKLLDDIFGDDSGPTVDVWFENEQHALLFKLAWGGK